MRSRLQVAFTVATTLTAQVAGICLGCSSSSTAQPPGDTTPGTGNDAAADAAPPVTYLAVVSGTLKQAVPQSELLDEQLVVSARPEAQAAGDVGHDSFLNMDGIGGDGGSTIREALTLDRWTSLDGLNAFLASPEVQTFLGEFYASPPDISAWQPQVGWTTWGSPADWAPAATNYVITLRGRYQGDEPTAEATHNGIVAGVPAPGAVGLGNSAHMVFVNPKDRGEILIVEVWTNENNQQMAYAALAPAIAKLWAGMPAITRWSTTSWTRW
jgi:quinol monooxygenase YgiN